MKSMERKYRVLIAKPGLDGHDRGAKFVARALRDGGFEVIYTGLHQSPEQIVQTALQEDVDVIGLSILSGGQIPLITRFFDLLGEQRIRDILVVIGGIIPRVDRETLIGLGVARIFGPGTRSHEISDYLKEALAVRG